MSGFILDDESLDQISGQLPDLENLTKTIFKFVPDFISVKCPVDSNIPVAAVCLHDMLNTLFGVRIALREYHANRIWYREKSDPPNKSLATVMMKYYVDDAATRLYAAGEHLANAIICMLDIKDSQLEPYRKNRTSQQSIVGHYLVNEFPQNPITVCIINLVKSREWSNAVEYRNKWVHEQPPTIHGLGVAYKRKKRWIINDEGNGKVTYTLGLGTGDGADFSVDDIMGFVQPAVFKFVAVCDEVVSFYTQILGKHGITITDKGISLKLFEAAKPKKV
ncbi:MAG: hypothetical protein AB1516_15210 [Pseudomonadota bacterium]